MAHRGNPCVIDLAAVWRSHKFAGSERCYPDFPHSTGSLMVDLKINHETSTNDVVATVGIFVSCNVTSNIV
jgi:hypothetical protein